MITLIHAAQVDKWVSVWWPLIIPALTVIIAGIIAGSFAIANRKGTEKNARKAPLPPTWPEMWERIDGLEKRMAALESENDDLKDDNGTMRDHIVVLEGLIPVPPGVPIRPTLKWSPPAATDRVVL